MITKSLGRAKLAGDILIFSIMLAKGFAAGDSNIPDPPWLHDELIAVRKTYELPAMAAAVVYDGRIFAASAVGYRKLGDMTLVTRDDTFHLGSITKLMTITLVGVLVDEKVLTWNTTMAEMFPELVATMQPAYRTVTVQQLLWHKSGMPYQPRTPESVTDSRARDAVGRRYEYVKAAVMDEPEALPGTKEIYGGGSIIVASFLERKFNTSYEQLMENLIFSKLAMSRAGFGSMATVGHVNGPWEHQWLNGKFVPVPPRADQFVQARAPAGRNVHCTVMDLARFLAMHLFGAQDRSQFLTSATFRHLQFGTIGYAGSTGINYAVCTIDQEQNLALCVMTNAGNGPAAQACNEVQSFIRDHLKSLKGNPIGEAGQVAKPDAGERLKQIKALLGQGLISQEVYDQKREEILDSL